MTWWRTAGSLLFARAPRVVAWGVVAEDGDPAPSIASSASWQWDIFCSVVCMSNSVTTHRLGVLPLWLVQLF